MAVSVPGRNDDQVKDAGSDIERTTEVRENLDGGLPADHAGGGPGRVVDHGISEADHINVSPLVKGGSQAKLGVAFGARIGGPFEDRQGFVADNVAARFDVPLVVDIRTAPAAGPVGIGVFVSASAAPPGIAGAGPIPSVAGGASTPSTVAGVAGTLTSFLWTAFPGVIVLGTPTSPSITVITLATGPQTFTVLVGDSNGVSVSKTVIL